jgi:hypothetical protein
MGVAFAGIEKERCCQPSRNIPGAKVIISVPSIRTEPEPLMLTRTTAS